MKTLAPSRLTPRVLLVVALAVFGVDCVVAETPRPLVPTVEWNTTIDTFQFDAEKYLGQRLTVRCPQHTVRDSDAPIYGTTAYTSDSAICVAAVHAGALGRSGGLVTVQLNPGVDRYVGSTGNDILSLDRPATRRSLMILHEGTRAAADEVRNAYALPVDWDTPFTRTGLANRDHLGQRFAFVCPAMPARLVPRKLHGTDRYAFNSRLCRTAVHAGVLGASGGRFLVQLEPGVAQLVGSIRNGIETENSGGGSRTLTFLPLD